MTSHARPIAAIVTLVAAAGIVVVLLCSSLAWNPAQPWPPLPEPYIELAREEFVEVEELPVPRTAAERLDAPAQLPENSDLPSQTAPESGASVRNQGDVGKPAREVTSKKPSEVKTTPKPKPDEAAAAAENERREREAASKRTNSDVTNAFAKSTAQNNADNRKDDKGPSGRTDGNPQSGGPANSSSTTAGVSHGELTGGWQWPAYNSKLPTDKTGSIILALTIDRTGTVVSAEVVGGKEPARSDATLRSKCIAIAKSRRFTRAANAGEAPERSTARLTFSFK